MLRRQFLQAGVAAALASIGGRAAAWDGITGGDAALRSPAPSDPILVRALLEALHPGLYRYQTPHAFDAAMRQLERDWAADERLERRYLALSRLLSRIRCGHSYANFFNQSDAVATALFDRPTRLPFAFRWCGDAMVVTANHSGAGGRTPVALPVGSVIKAVDGVAVSDIWRALAQYVRVDGHNDGKAHALLSVTGIERIEFFDIFHGLVFGAPGNGRFSLRYRTPGVQRDVTVDTPALTLTERRSQMVAASSDDDAASWQWTMRPDGIAILTMDSWALYNSRWDWRSWLNERLDSVGDAHGLVVDLRRNEGGLDCGDVILARLTDRPLPRRAGRRLVRYRSVPTHLRPYLDTWDDSFFDWGDDAQPFDSRYFLLRDENGDESIQPDTRRLRVPVAVLTSAQNSSAAFQFAQQVKRHRLGLLVGETTGGNQRGINGGAFLFARLPQSGLEFDIPLIGFFPEGRQPDAGITPDIVAAPTAEAIAAGDDRAMMAATRALRNR